MFIFFVVVVVKSTIDLSRFRPISEKDQKKIYFLSKF